MCVPCCRQVTSPPPGPGSRQPSQPPSRTGTLDKRNSGSQQSLLSGLVSRFSRSSSDLGMSSKYFSGNVKIFLYHGHARKYLFVS